MKSLSLGLDIGSISINTVVIGSDKKLLEEHYTLCQGRPFHALYSVLSDVLSRYQAESLSSLAITGTGAKLAAKLIGGIFVNEIVAQSRAVSVLYPQVKTVFEMGGEDSKLIMMNHNSDGGKPQLVDFFMNTVCAAGTGSFLDQQAKRMGVSIEGEFGELALKSEKPPHIAGRCSVFAKSDMIHLQQIATPVHDIVAGLCYAVVRNVKSNLARGKEVEKPVAFQGGVAANAGVVKAFREIFSLEDGELIIPEHYASMGAIGAVYTVLDHQKQVDGSFKGLSGLEDYLKAPQIDLPSWPPLKRSFTNLEKQVVSVPKGEEIDVYLGIDVGSLSTNVVLIDDEFNVVARRYLPTASKPLQAIQQSLSEIFHEVGGAVRVKAAGTTGSGRYLTGHFIGADTIKNEITSQARAAIHYHPEVDTVFEIGGQDSKYISIDNGVVVDFEMNKVCAAGTGSFLEEQAEKLGINIVDEFGILALSSKRPSKLGDRCTVFMESDLNSHQQKGARKDELVAGLAYSIVQNYIQKVVGAKRIGDHILFQGGVTNNPAVVAAFEEITGKKITVPPHFDVTGAIGAAMLAKEEMEKGFKPTLFKGFQISQAQYNMTRFICQSCENHCDVHKVMIEGEDTPLFYGDRCDRYQPSSLKEEKMRKRREIPNLFRLREKLLLGSFDESTSIVTGGHQKTIGIPRQLMTYYQRFPYWRTFFEELGFRIILSKPSDRPMVSKALSMLVAETCFPVEVMHGHIHDLIEKNCDYIFTPFVVDVPSDDQNPTANYNCPWVQSYPFMIKGSLKGQPGEEKFLIPTIHFKYGKKKLLKDLFEFMQGSFGMDYKYVKKAEERAEKAQKQFERSLIEEGQKLFSNLPKSAIPVVILGRPYNTGDPELNLGLVEKLIDLNVLPIPLDFLPLRDQSVGLFKDYDMMYWPNGQKILAGARCIAGDKRLHAVYLSNFRCGPDSFLSHYVHEEMGNKPYLQLEVDEHSADAGMITRCEAFLDSVKSDVTAQLPLKKHTTVSVITSSPSRDRVLYFPYMNDSAHMLAAATRACGVEARVLPMQDDSDLEWGRKYASSKECFPMICTTGSFLKKIHEEGFRPEKSGFFMPSHGGPCRFGQYHKYQRIIFEKLGYGDVEIVSPTNKNSYADFLKENGVKFRLVIWKGLLCAEYLGKMRQEKEPYESVKGETAKVYSSYLNQLIQSIETGGKKALSILKEAGEAFGSIKTQDISRKPVIAIVGEIFMRDNPYCSGFLRQRLEHLGAETIMAPVREWIELSSKRYFQESLWDGDWKKALLAKAQGFFQHQIGNRFEKAMNELIETERCFGVEEILMGSAPYIHRDYVGDPPLALGTAVCLSKTGISGVAAILPFSCLPGTIIASLSDTFRRDHGNMPWIDIAYDGQSDSGIETRLEAFIHQAKAYDKRGGVSGLADLRKQEIKDD
ncbi:MAG TPA: acyl-CoA dehydratase activase [Thermotogota bacterium]|nr:acyl-CoA dehydratase activase [Thermotogota bacterium]HRW35540.1 acyl-CoA dehydratase activase [Thermotogota bacterium]